MNVSDAVSNYSSAFSFLSNVFGFHKGRTPRPVLKRSIAYVTANVTSSYQVSVDFLDSMEYLKVFSARILNFRSAINTLLTKFALDTKMSSIVSALQKDLSTIDYMGRLPL